MYNKYSDYLKTKYGCKVYKLPVNLPITCPNRLDGPGCFFCSEVGTGFEAMDSIHSVKSQIDATKELIAKKYKADKFIAYFQNYTNTFMPLEVFRAYMKEAASCSDIVELSISTRPDCIKEEYLDVLNQIHQDYHVDINIELGIQTVNYRTLDSINRGHSLAEFIDAVINIKKYPFTICSHFILNLPSDDIRDVIENAKIASALNIDIVKLHSLYIAKNTILAKQYLDGKFQICSKEEYMQRLQTFLEYLKSDIVVERLFSRIPEEDSVFCNWNTSWRKLQDEFIEKMTFENSFQGKQCNYLNGGAFQKL